MAEQTQDKANQGQVSNLSNNEKLRCELDQIESKIKTAIHHNHQVHTNSVELEFFLRKSLSSEHATLIPTRSGVKALRIESLNTDLSHGSELPILSSDDRPQDSTFAQENIKLKQEVIMMKQELDRMHQAKMQDEKEHTATVNKLKKDLRNSNRLIRKLQTNKLADMENNFMTSFDLLEAKLSEEINNGDKMEERLAAMKAERDTARELNLPLFNELKKLYEIKVTLEQQVEELNKQVSQGQKCTTESKVNDYIDTHI